VSLQQLASADIEPNLPDISHSYHALQRYLGGTPVTPAKPEGAANDKAEDKDKNKKSVTAKAKENSETKAAPAKDKPTGPINP